MRAHDAAQLQHSHTPIGAHCTPSCTTLSPSCDGFNRHHRAYFLAIRSNHPWSTQHILDKHTQGAQAVARTRRCFRGMVVRRVPHMVHVMVDVHVVHYDIFDQAMCFLVRERQTLSRGEGQSASVRNQLAQLLVGCCCRVILLWPTLSLFNALLMPEGEKPTTNCEIDPFPVRSSSCIAPTFIGTKYCM